MFRRIMILKPDVNQCKTITSPENVTSVDTGGSAMITFTPGFCCFKYKPEPESDTIIIWDWRGKDRKMEKLQKLLFPRNATISGNPEVGGTLPKQGDILWPVLYLPASLPFQLRMWLRPLGLVFVAISQDPLSQNALYCLRYYQTGMNERCYRSEKVCCGIGKW